uniref:Uncharacterized protein n=1 Tax=Glossina palpalis gambiensis TaxID=67801 RepID=A0A1B0BVX5_9MUSC
MNQKWTLRSGPKSAAVTSSPAPSSFCSPTTTAIATTSTIAGRSGALKPPDQQRHISLGKTYKDDINNNNFTTDLIISIKFHNDYVRLLNTVAYMLRFIYNCEFKAKRKYGSLDVSELDASRLKIIKYIEIISFHAAIAAVQKGSNLNDKSHIHSLSPFLR